VLWILGKVEGNGNGQKTISRRETTRIVSRRTGIEKTLYGENDDEDKKQMHALRTQSGFWGLVYKSAATRVTGQKGGVRGVDDKTNGGKRQLNGEGA